MNKRGQALVEFIIILPIFILLMLAVFDYVRIIETKMKLESTMEDVILDENMSLENNITLFKDNKDNKVEYVLSKEIEIYSPVLSGILSNPYRIEIKRVLNE